MAIACNLADKQCTSCTPATPSLKYPRLKRLLADVPLWRYGRSKTNSPALVRHFRFTKFADAIAFVDKVAIVADTEGHHPDIEVENYNQVILTMFTHTINDVSENDFIMAAKIDIFS